jgi:hypothetical protein
MGKEKEALRIFTESKVKSSIVPCPVNRKKPVCIIMNLITW